MTFKNFRLGVIWRITLITACIGAWMYLVLHTSYYISIAIVSIAILGLTSGLIRYVEQTNDKLSRFLNAIQYSDFSVSFRDQGLGPSFKNLNKAFADVIDTFQQERAKKHISHRYLQTVVQHIGIGLICFTPKGEVELINTAAKRLFDIPVLRTMDKLKTIDKQLYQTVMNIQGGQRTLLQVPQKQEPMQLSISATEFRMRDELYKLVSIQNIHTELEEKQMEAWQNLTQVLAHEIMNSMTPVASLSETVHMLLNHRAVAHNGNYSIEKEPLNDVKEALKTINSRSQGLMRFVDSYREFTQIPDPKIKLISVHTLLTDIKNLNKGLAKSKGVIIETQTTPKTLEISADPDLIEQVLINLIKNAFRALDGISKPKITLTGRLADDGSTIIEVRDNGPGIAKENQEKIFIPFYSTTQSAARGGSGIGLSLSRQIMKKHGGSLTVSSIKNQETTFLLKF